MMALEAWARGLPLVIDRSTGRALGAEDGVHAVVADGAGDFAAALARLMEESGLRQRVIDGGRAALRDRHEPAGVAERLVRVYRLALNRS